MCACENGKTCLYHEAVKREHQAMWKALREIAEGAERDPGEVAQRALDKVERYRH